MAQPRAFLGIALIGRLLAHTLRDSKTDCVGQIISGMLSSPLWTCYQPGAQKMSDFHARI